MFEIENEIRRLVRGCQEHKPLHSADASARIQDEWHRKNVLHARTLNAFENWFIQNGKQEEFEAILESIKEM